MRENQLEVSGPEWEDEISKEESAERNNLPATLEGDDAVSALVEVEKSRSASEIQAAIISAKRFPRDTTKAYTKTIAECKRIGLAKLSQYKFPRAGQMVDGPSIRLAEALKRSYGNLEAGWAEIERRKGVSLCMAWCWDMENNNIDRIKFEVPHEISLKGGRTKRLTDPRDIYELCANQSARRLRKVILNQIPGDFIDGALAQCRKTLAAGDGKESLEDRIRKMVLAFKDLGVSQEMIEERMEHKIELTTADELVDLISIFNSLKDGQAKRKDFFNFADVDEAGGKAAEFREAIRNQGGTDGGKEAEEVQ